MLGVAARGIGRRPAAAAAAAAVSRSLSVGVPMTAVATATATAATAAGASRQFSGVRFLDEKRTGEETVYFKKEDEALLRRLLAKHPEADPKFQSSGGSASLESLQSSLSLCVSKHFKQQAPKAFLDELTTIFASHGWQPPEDLKGHLLRSMQTKPRGAS
ncbi:uncharacterized protein EMH_0004070 [Eimeria mitis]|uniref:Uncharacterized protein n=1 Tax=Eimeria mitis TaxID=44415 RepID=U6KKL2_9EIME|nr:uncharacterized protein EMH_0004070 [Eimeria mitis]CDJ35988.1 hypothetical protein, conserved [Eimeria mitis]